MNWTMTTIAETCGDSPAEHRCTGGAMCVIEKPEQGVTPCGIYPKLTDIWDQQGGGWRVEVKEPTREESQKVLS